MPIKPTEPAGYRRKPVWIRLLAFALILAPAGNIVFTLAVLNLKLDDWQNWLYWLRYVRPEVWAMNFLLFSAGVALLKVRTWTHLLASFALAVMIIYNIVYWESLLFLGPSIFAAMLVTTLVAAGVLYSRQFRKPYFNPRVRWWETEPRYRAKLRVTITLPDGEKQPGEILDVSRSGLFVALEGSTELAIGEEHHVVLPTGIELRGQIVRRDANGFGIRFVRLGWEQRMQLKIFVEQLSHDPRTLLR